MIGILMRSIFHFWYIQLLHMVYFFLNTLRDQLILTSLHYSHVLYRLLYHHQSEMLIFNTNIKDNWKMWIFHNHLFHQRSSIFYEVQVLILQVLGDRFPTIPCFRSFKEDISTPFISLSLLFPLLFIISIINMEIHSTYQ